MRINNKIKKITCLIMASVFVCASLTACGSGSKESRLDGSNNVQNAIDEQIAKESSTEEATTEAPKALVEPTTEATEEKTTEAKKEEATPSEAASKPNEVYDKIDIDLTTMSSDMVYSTVYQMMYEPDDFVGKVVKMSGAYYPSWYDATQQYYHYVIIKDATACCQQGMEFVWGDGSHVYPDEYPAEQTEVEVVGVYELYKDNPDDQMEYCRLKDCTFEVINEAGK